MKTDNRSGLVNFRASPVAPADCHKVNSTNGVATFTSSLSRGDRRNEFARPADGWPQPAGVRPTTQLLRPMRPPSRPSDDRLTFTALRDPMPAWKRGLDVSCCLLALPVLSFLVLAMSAITWLVAPGPVFFSQERIGYRGRRFKIFKFRTMTAGADTTVHQNHFTAMRESNAPMLKLDTQGDSRLIPGAWMLRATGLDELPQIINVLCGDMTLVGPRPCLPSEFAQYLPAQCERVNAMPGLTGLWQVSGKNRTTFDEMIRLDIHYARNVSLLLDGKIILLTPWALAVQFWDTRVQRKSLAPARANPTQPAFQAPTRSVAC